MASVPRNWGSRCMIHGRSAAKTDTAISYQESELYSGIRPANRPLVAQSAAVYLNTDGNANTHKPTHASTGNIYIQT